MEKNPEDEHEDVLGGDTRLHALQREQIEGLRDEAERAKQEARAATAAHDRLVDQMREANQKLLLATVRAETLATEAHAARLEMAASEERFRTLVTTSTAIVFGADAAGRMRMNRESWRSFTGLEAPEDDDPSGEWHWLAAVHPAEVERVRATWVRATASGLPYTKQHRLRRADGTYAWVAASAVPIPGGRPTREWIGMLTDISDRIRVDEAREQFIAILGHDLRAPLSVIVMATQLFEHSGLRPREADLVVRIVRSTRRMDTMIGALLDFARGRLGGGIPIERAPCDLASLCGEAVAEAKLAHPSRDISCHSSGDVRGDWDRDRFEQVLSNLLANAVLHGADPIEVRSHGEGDHVVVAVHNRGRAIPPDMIATLFEPFHERALGSKAGLGLGLYIVSEIVRAHGGTVGASSTTEDGTRLTIELPRAAA